MSSRDEILRAIRQHTIAPTPLPDLEGDWIRYPDRVQQFSEVLASVGGEAVCVADWKALLADLHSRPTFEQAKVRLSAIPEIACSTFNLAAVEDPHMLEDLDFAIFPAEFAVAENGAVWVTERQLRHRVVYFITQHLAMVVPRTEIVDNMHQAYERLSFQGRGFGMFLSGPSKTADIEQSLVIGAHGARSLTVYLLG